MSDFPMWRHRAIRSCTCFCIRHAWEWYSPEAGWCQTSSPPSHWKESVASDAKSMLIVYMHIYLMEEYFDCTRHLSLAFSVPHVKDVPLYYLLGKKITKKLRERDGCLKKSAFLRGSKNQWLLRWRKSVRLLISLKKNRNVMCQKLIFEGDSKLYETLAFVFSDVFLC